ncbi:MAG: bifunctional riboflavin kinase/FAD synthetase [Limisphaerales bacterium]
MRLIHAASEFQPGTRKVSLAIGFFDGVHLGHQQTIRQAIADARQHEAHSLVITFDLHPNAVVAPGRVHPLIYSLPQKVRTIGSLGVDALLLLHFDEPFSRQTGEGFIRGLARDLGQILSVCVGTGFVFGYKRGGNVELLKRLGAELRFAVHAVASVSLGGRAVSSTRIRAAIVAGDLDAANQMLGRPYSLAGPVVEGDRLGRQLGFPTANIDARGLVLPPSGVYAVQALAGGQTYRAVLNIGTRPTLAHPDPQLRAEAHLLGFQGDLYGHEIEITFVEKLREERRFASLEELRRQIAQDVLAARSRFDP